MPEGREKAVERVSPPGRGEWMDQRLTEYPKEERHEAQERQDDCEGNPDSKRESGPLHASPDEEVGTDENVASVEAPLRIPHVRLSRMLSRGLRREEMIDEEVVERNTGEGEEDVVDEVGGGKGREVGDPDEVEENAGDG
jgi:hypothetical protein